MELKEILFNDFDGIYAEMEKNFIASERRDYSEQKNLLNNPLFKTYHIIIKDKKVGFITVWLLKNCAFIEHFVIFEEERGKGLGEQALNMIKQIYSNVVLECEPETLSALANRRLNFYKRNGFYNNGIEYFQPPYRKNGLAVRLELMSYPTPLLEVEKVVEEIYQKVYNR